MSVARASGTTSETRRSRPTERGCGAPTKATARTTGQRSPLHEEPGDEEPGEPGPEQYGIAVANKAFALQNRPVTEPHKDPIQDVTERNRSRQTQWYGEPLNDRFRRLLQRLSTSQMELAAVLGLSAPMLSQLMSGQRAKIGNPAVLSRLQEIELLVADPDFDRLTEQERQAALNRIRAHQPSSRTALRLNGPEVSAGPRFDPAAAVHAVLRAAASAAEIEAAATLLVARYPGLAEVLRVYGNGRTSDARDHFNATVSL